ncbi:WecB/TagA/CpsF family glycosyltransferase [Sphingopyxis indica]|uniref:WecB/TagA/CpsF family glycosyltransferase n=1 Tax=Sphingopyxis indica TaxID=436663 RepID=UPI0029395415|nr:WecB/TagA/CpsF family glycosyltransferase [Sphingopyxis indica]WOF44577.1 WecB/TagA/CpsF family glycosyltransferase [Sphingopyxis indica]
MKHERAKLRRAFLSLQFDCVASDTLLGQMAARSAEKEFAYLVTPNVDHVVRLHSIEHKDDRVRAAYDNAQWCTCDSRILALLAAMQGIRLPVVTGSDLTADVLQSALGSGDRIALVGGKRSSARLLRKMFPEIEIVEHQPPMGLMSNPVAIEAAAAFIAESKARFTFISVGSPQQELIAHATFRRPDATGIGLCVGAAIEFVVGGKRRAPPLVQKLKLEWAFRLFCEPARLWRRYLVEGPRILLIALAEFRHRPRY